MDFQARLPLTVLALAMASQSLAYEDHGPYSQSNFILPLSVLLSRSRKSRKKARTPKLREKTPAQACLQ